MECQGMINCCLGLGLLLVQILDPGQELLNLIKLRAGSVCVCVRLLFNHKGIPTCFQN